MAISSLIESGLPYEFEEAIKVRCYYLLTQIDMRADIEDDFIQHEKEIASISDLNNSETFKKNLTKLPCCAEYIIKNKKVGDMPFNSFISTLPKQHVVNIESLQAIFLIVALKYNSQDEFSGIIKVSLNTIRIMLTKDSGLLMQAKLPDFRQSLTDILISLEEIINYESDDTFKRKFQNIYSTLNYYVTKNPKKKINRERITKEGKHSGFRKMEHFPVSEPSEEEITELNEFDIEDIKLISQKDELETDDTPSNKYLDIKLTPKSSLKKSLALQQVNSKNIAKQVTKRKKQLPCDASQLTSFEIRIFLTEAYHSLEKNFNLSHLICLLTLFTAKSPEDLIRLITKDKLSIKTITCNLVEFNQLEISTKFTLTEFKLDQDIHKLLTPSLQVLKIRLPSKASLWFQQAQRISINKDKTIEFAQIFIKAINKKFNTRLTLTRLRNYMGYFLKRSGVDPAIISLLTQQHSINHPGLYYCLFETEQIERAHYNFITALIRLNENKDTIKIGEFSQATGTQLKINQNAVSAIFKGFTNALSGIKHSLETLEEFHNLFTLYSLQILFISSGHRPVRNPFESIEIFDLHSQAIFISDKESRSQLSARMIVLPDIAIKQFDFVMRHLTNIRKELTFYKPDLVRQINESIQGDKPLFFFLTDGNINYVTPQNLNSYLETILPLPLNWHRHFLRSSFSNLSICGDWIDAWMGHADFGDEGFSRFSYLSLDNLSSMAQQLNQLLEHKLGIKALPGFKAVKK